MRNLIKYMAILTILPFFITNNAIASVGIDQYDVDIYVDGTSKSVSPGQDAIFYWSVYNNCTLVSIDFSVSSYGNNTVFSQSMFTLGPHENRLVEQYCPTLMNDSNGTQYSYHVTWSGTIRFLATSYHIPAETQTLDVTVVKNNESEQFDDEYPNYYIDHNPIHNPINLGLVLVIGLIIIILWKFFFRRKKGKNSNGTKGNFYKK